MRFVQPHPPPPSTLQRARPVPVRNLNGAYGTEDGEELYGCSAPAGPFGGGGGPAQLQRASGGHGVLAGSSTSGAAGTLGASFSRVAEHIPQAAQPRHGPTVHTMSTPLAFATGSTPALALRGVLGGARQPPALRGAVSAAPLPPWHRRRRPGSWDGSGLDAGLVGIPDDRRGSPADWEEWAEGGSVDADDSDSCGNDGAHRDARRRRQGESLALRPDRAFGGPAPDYRGAHADADVHGVRPGAHGAGGAPAAGYAHQQPARSHGAIGGGRPPAASSAWAAYAADSDAITELSHGDKYGLRPGVTLPALVDGDEYTHAVHNFLFCGDVAGVDDTVLIDDFRSSFMRPVELVEIVHCRCVFGARCVHTCVWGGDEWAAAVGW